MTIPAQQLTFCPLTVCTSQCYRFFYNLSSRCQIFKLLLVLFVGGMPDAQSRTLQKFASGFKGCLRDMVLGGDISQDILSSAESGRNVVPCH